MRRLRSRLRGVTYPVVANSETTSLLARMSYPGNARAYQIDTLIGALKTGGMWAKLDALYVLAAHEQASAVLNWVSTSYNLTGGTPPTTFVADRYVQGNGTTQFYDTQFNPTTAPTPKFVQNSAHLAMWQVNTAGVAALGHTGATIVPTATPTFRLNGAAGITGSGSPTTGYFTATRTSSVQVYGYVNGVENVQNGAVASTTPSNETLYLCARNQATDTFSSGRLTIAHFGEALSAGEVASAYAAFNTYLTSIGAV